MLGKWPGGSVGRSQELLRHLPQNQPVEDTATSLTCYWTHCLGGHCCHGWLGNLLRVVAGTLHQNAFSTVPHLWVISSWSKSKVDAIDWVTCLGHLLVP